MRRRPVMVATVLLGLVMAALPLSGATATHNTEFCRNEPNDPNEDGITVSDSSGELAFVGYDTDFPPGGGVLVCANVLGVNTNVGYVPGADVGLVRDCSPSRQVSDDSCRVSASVAAVQGDGFAFPGIDPVVGQFQTIEVFLFVQTVGTVKGGLTALALSQCVAQLSSSIPETYAFGAGTGQWECLSGPLDGFTGFLDYERALNSTGILVSGDLIGALDCVTTDQPLPPQPITWFHIVCGGGGAS